MLRIFIKDVVSNHINSDDIEKVREHLSPIYMVAKLGMEHEELVEMFSRAYDPIEWSLGQKRMQARMLLGILVVADNYELGGGLTDVGEKVVKALLDSCAPEEVTDYVQQTLAVFQLNL
jgi:hypothetical protein